MKEIDEKLFEELSKDDLDEEINESSKDEKKELRYLYKKEKVCPLDKEERYKLQSLIQKYGKPEDSLEEERLEEGTSNFPTRSEFPLLVFYTYDEFLYNMTHHPDYPQEEQFENERENGDFYVDWDAFEEAKDEFEQKYWDKNNICVLTEDDQERLESKLDDFNDETNNIANNLYDADNDDDYYALKDIELRIEPGYYEAAYIDVDGEEQFEYMSEDVAKAQRERFNNFFKELKKEFGLTQLSLAYRASNGETGFNIVKDEALEEDKSICHNCGAELGMEKYTNPKTGEVLCADCYARLDGEEDEDESLKKSYKENLKEGVEFIDSIELGTRTIGDGPYHDGDGVIYLLKDGDKYYAEYAVENENGPIEDPEYLDDVGEHDSLEELKAALKEHNYFKEELEENKSLDEDDTLDEKKKKKEPFVKVGTGFDIAKDCEMTNHMLGSDCCEDLDNLAGILDELKDAIANKDSKKEKQLRSALRRLGMDDTTQNILLSEDFDEFDTDSYYDDEDICIYQFPRSLDKRDFAKAEEFGLEVLGKVNDLGFQPGDPLIRGKYKDLKRYCDEYLDYVMHPYYLYKEGDIDLEDILEPANECLKEMYDDFVIEDKFIEYMKSKGVKNPKVFDKDGFFIEGVYEKYAQGVADTYLEGNIDWLDGLCNEERCFREDDDNFDNSSDPYYCIRLDDGNYYEEDGDVKFFDTKREAEEFRIKNKLWNSHVTWDDAATNESLNEEKQYDGKCPFCGSENIDFVDSDEDSEKHVCHDCGQDFLIHDDGHVTTRNNRPIESLEESNKKFALVVNGEWYSTYDSYEKADEAREKFLDSCSNEDDAREYYGECPNIDIREINDEELKESMKSEVTNWWKDVEDANKEMKWEINIDNGDYSDVEAMHAAMFDMLDELDNRGAGELFKRGKKIYNKYAKYSKYNESLKESAYDKDNLKDALKELNFESEDGCNYIYKGNGKFEEVVSRLQNKFGKFKYVSEPESLITIECAKEESLDEALRRYKIEYWVDEEARDQGLGDIAIETFDDLEDAKEYADKLFSDVASVEVLDTQDKDNVVYGRYPEDESMNEGGPGSGDHRTAAQRYNDRLHATFRRFDEMNNKMAQFLLDHDVSPEEVEELKKNTGLHGNALHQKLIELGLDDEFFERKRECKESINAWSIKPNEANEEIEVLVKKNDTWESIASIENCPTKDMLKEDIVKEYSKVARQVIKESGYRLVESNDDVYSLHVKVIDANTGKINKVERLMSGSKKECDARKKQLEETSPEDSYHNKNVYKVSKVK